MLCGVDPAGTAAIKAAPAAQGFRTDVLINNQTLMACGLEKSEKGEAKLHDGQPVDHLSDNFPCRAVYALAQLRVAARRLSLTAAARGCPAASSSRSRLLSLTRGPWPPCLQTQPNDWPERFNGESSSCRGLARNSRSGLGARLPPSDERAGAEDEGGCLPGD